MVRLSSAFLIGALACVPTWANSLAGDTCHRQSGQYADTQTCVSSVLAPQGAKSYGPDRLTGSSEHGAWCEGVPGPGIGQSVTLHQHPENVVGAVIIRNGYAKTAQSHRANGRVKSARIETSGGYARTITLKDTREQEEITFPPSKVSWVRLTILATYPGERHSDTCLSALYFNQEEFGAIEDPRDETTDNSK